MNISDKGLALIQEFESYLKPQPDGSRGLIVVRRRRIRRRRRARRARVGS